MAFATPAKKLNNRGRPSGGLVTFIPIEQGYRVRQLQWTKSNNFQILLISNNTGGDFLCFNVYIPPVCTSSQTIQIWEDLESCLEKAKIEFPDWNILLAGDFNARIGSDINSYGSKTQFLPGADWFIPWSSDEKVLNKAGNALLEIAFKHNLYNLHGTYMDRAGGFFSFIGPRGTSVIDHILVSPTILERAQGLSTFNRTESDHLPIAISLTPLESGGLQHLHCAVPPQAPAPRRRKWNSELELKIKQHLHSPDLLVLRDQCLLPNFDPFSLYQWISESLFPLLINTRPPKQYNKSGVWFDKDCRKLRSLLRKQQNKVKQERTLSSMVNFHRWRSYYKNTLKLKKSLYRKEQWEALDKAIKLRDDRKFWDIIAQGVSSKGKIVNNSISSDVWFQHFSQLYAPSNTANSSPSLPLKNDHLASWDPVTESECLQLIKTLKNGKAPGEDMIPPEVFKSNDQWWAIFLAKLFTVINNTCKIPANWKLSLVAPIYKKGDIQDPANYRPVSLLDIAYKLYTRYLLNKLVDWADHSNLFNQEQAGFRKGHNTISHCMVLQTLIAKYSKAHKSRLFVAFVDLSLIHV